MAHTRKSQNFNVDGEDVLALEAEGASDLSVCLQEIQQDIQKEAFANYQQSKSRLSQLFRPTPKNSVENLHSMRAILYTTPNLTPGSVAHHQVTQRSLIMTNGKEHYFYDLLKGNSVLPFQDVLNALAVTDPSSWKGDVSGEESRKNLRDSNGNIGEAREKSKKNLPDNDLAAAVTHAVRQIKNTINPPMQKEVTHVNAGIVRPGGVAG